MTIKNLTIKKGNVVIGGFGVPSEAITVTSISKVANLPQEHKNIIKDFIITGTTEADLVGIKTLGEELSNLESIELKNMTEVPEDLFFIDPSIQNTWLEYFSAPEAVTISTAAFYECDVLKEIYLPKAITIKFGAFFSCNELTKVYLPKATTIGNGAFDGCDALRILKLGGTSINVETDAFYNLSTNLVDLYLSEEEYNTVTGANNKWENKTLKSIAKIVL